MFGYLVIINLGPVTPRIRAKVWHFQYWLVPRTEYLHVVVLIPIGFACAGATGNHPHDFFSCWLICDLKPAEVLPYPTVVTLFADFSCHLRPFHSQVVHLNHIWHERYSAVYSMIYSHISFLYQNPNRIVSVVAVGTLHCSCVRHSVCSLLTQEFKLQTALVAQFVHVTRNKWQPSVDEKFSSHHTFGQSVHNKTLFGKLGEVLYYYHI